MTRYERWISCQAVYICLNRERESATLSSGRSQSEKKTNKPAKHRIEPLPDKQKAKILAPVVLLLLVVVVVLSSRFTVASQGTPSRLGRAHLL